MTANDPKITDLSTFQPTGELTIYTAAENKDKLLDLIGRSKSLEIDLSQVNECDSAGLQLLILAQRESQRQNLDIKLTGHSEAVLEVVDLFNLSGFLGDPRALSNQESTSGKAS